MTNVDIIHNGSNFCLPLYIVKGDKPSLLGRDWLKKVKSDWKNVLGQISLKGKHSLNKILDDHSSVLDGQLGIFKDRYANLRLKPDNDSTYRAVRTVPYNLVAKGENELDKWEKNWSD